ncbi:MAG: hypothetical protein L0Y68_08375 [Candidatus Dadabacteria bacterium]|nr:hypothetical protein [Candidatus Dadabacteria bacterium]
MDSGFKKGGEAKGRELHFFLIFIIVGFISRIFLSPYLTHGDIRSWKTWATGISNVGFSQFYDVIWCDYMPGYLYILWLLEHIHSAFPKIPDTVLFKLPANLSDLGISIFIFFVLRNITSLKNAKIASLAYFFNPASLSNSTFWGQVDSVHALPILASIILGVRRRFVLSSLFIVVAFMIKPQSLVIFPVIGFFILREVFLRKDEDDLVLKTSTLVLKIIAVSIITIVLISLPFIWGELSNNGVMGIFKETFLFIKDRFYTAYNGYKYTSANAFNFWGMLHGMWKSDQDAFLDVTYQRWGTIMFGVFYVLILGFLCRFELSGRNFIRVQQFNLLEKQNAFCSENGSSLTIRSFYAVTLIFFALFLFVTRAHERHFLTTVVFFTTISFLSWRNFISYLIVSAVYVANMIYAYTKYNPIQGFSPSSMDPYIPGIVALLLTIFLIVLTDFIRNSFKPYRVKSP